MSITSCIRKAGSALRPEDKKAVLAGARTYRGDGLSPDDAAKKAIADQIETIRKAVAKEEARLLVKPQPSVASTADVLASDGKAGLLSAFRQFKGEALPETAAQDAEKVLGFRPDVRIAQVNDSARPNSPMWYNTARGLIEYNTAVPHYRASDAQFMAEEFIHAVDATGPRMAISAGSPRFLKNGDIRNELEELYKASAFFRQQLEYPFEYGFSDGRTAVELFAKAGVIFHSFPNALKTVAPITFKAYDEIFIPTIRRGFRTSAARNSESGGGGIRGAGFAGGTGQSTSAGQADNGLASLAARIASVTNGRPGGTAVDGLETFESRNQSGTTGGLTSPTQADVLAQQQRKADGDKAETKAAKATEQKAKADAEVGEFALTGSDRAANVGAAGGQGSMFARGDATKKELVIQHNLTAENLIFADRMGGLAVPSLAITKVDAPLQNFGEITLLGDVNMADPKQGIKAYGADIYSPRYPKVDFKSSAKLTTAINDTLAPHRQGNDRALYSNEVVDMDSMTTHEPFKRYAEARGARPGYYHDYKAQAQTLLQAVGADEHIFQGFTNSGNRKYKPHTLENVIAILKKELRGGENFNYGAGSLRARFTPQFRSVEAIRKAAGTLVSKDQFEAIKDEVNTELIDIADALGKPTDTAIAIFEDAPKMGLKRAAREYGIDLGDEQAQRMAQFLTRLRNMPTEYFEGKMLRAMGIREFKAAVVPDGVSPKALEILNRDGVKVYTYKKGDEADRARVLKKAAEETPGGVFARSRLGSSSGMPTADVQKSVDAIAGTWTAGPAIKVVATPADLPVDAPADARGLIDNGTAYIVASNHRNAADVGRTLAHEAIGHYGLWAMLGDAGTKSFQRNVQLAIKSGNKPLNAISAEVRRLYVDDAGKFNLSPAEEANEIAALAVEQALDDKGEFKPGFGFVKAAYSKIAEFLRGLGIKVAFTNAELQGMLVRAQAGVKAGERGTGGAPSLVAAARDPSDEKALKVLSQMDDLFALPKSDKTDVQGIADDHGLGIKVKQSKVVSDTLYTLTFPDGGGLARLWVRPANPYGDQIYSMEMVDGSSANMQVGRPGENPEDVNPDIEDVFLDVSGMKTGKNGAAVYNIAATFAHNSGRIFIGDPSGLTDVAIRRRLENMISSALKFGTTDHIAPHPYQVNGKMAIGVPALKWVYGDSVGNIERMIDVSIKATENVFPTAKNLSYDIESGQFRHTGTQRGIPFEDLFRRIDGNIRKLRESSSSAPSEGQAGWRTVARNALFRALQAPALGDPRATGGGLLDRLGQHASGLRAGGSRGGVDQKESRIFYARGGGKGNQPGVDQTVTPAFKKWFGESKVVDADGKPLVLYHGTDKGNIKSFFEGGHFGDAGQAQERIDRSGKADGATIYPVYLKIENPVRTQDFGDDAAWNRAIDRAAADGHDGIIYRNDTEGAGRDSYLVWDQSQVKSAIGNNGDFDSASPNIAFARGAANLFQPNIWNAPADTKTDRLIYNVQNTRVDLNRVQEAITESGQKITEQWDARLAETLYPGRVAHRTQSFLEGEPKSLFRAMKANNVGMDELADYLHARGAEERNVQIAKVNPGMPDGGAGTNTKGTLMTTQAAKDYLAAVSPTRTMVLAAMAKRVDAITAGTRNLLVAEGLEKQETIDAWTAAYKNYVPMFRDEAAESFPSHPQGAGFTVKGSASKRAMGSKKEVTNILAHVLMQREVAITRAEKNRVALALYGQALSHPNPDFWTTIQPSMQAEAIGKQLTAMGVDPLTAEVGMAGVPTVQTIDPNTGKVVNRPNPMYKTLPGAITLKVNGDDRVLMLNVKHPRGERLAASLKNMDGLTDLDLASGLLSKFWPHLFSPKIGVAGATRWMASVNTQYNPAFGLVNLTRDVLGGAINLGSTELRGNALKVLFNTPAAIFGVARELASGGSTGKWSKLYADFVADGGQTGFKENFRDPGDRARAIEKEIKALGRSKLNPVQYAHYALDLLDGFNTTLENAVRVSTYKAGLDKGLSRAESARLGRELTVDFNRKGRLGREAGPLYAFFNASVQGSARTIATLKGPTGKGVIMGGLGLGIMQAVMLAAAGYDDDEIPEFVKTRALIIPMLGGTEKTYISIPYPLGLHVIPNTGRVMAELALNGGKDIGKRSVMAVGEIAAAFNPLGGSDLTTKDGWLKMAAPTVVDPIIEMITNKNFAGTEIEKRGFGDETDNRPGINRARESTQRNTTGQVYMGISKAMNAATGGSDYEAGAVSPTPEMVRYVSQTIGGGVLREIEKSVNASTAASRGDKVKSSQIPVMGRFYGEVDDEQVQRGRYFKSDREMKSLTSVSREIKKHGTDAELDAFEKKHPEIELERDFQRTRARIAKLNRFAVETINDPKELASIDADRAEEMREINAEIKALEKASGKVTPAEKLREVVKEKVPSWR